MIGKSLMESTKTIGLRTCVVATIVLVAWAMRVLDLDTLPPGMDRDLAANGVYTLYMLHEGLRPLFYRIGAAEPLIVYLQSLSVATLGVGVFSLRIVTAILGWLTITALYATVRVAGFDWRLAATAALGLAISVEHTHLSRLGLRAIFIPLVELMLLFFFWRGIQRRDKRDFIVAGIVLGIGFYTYVSAPFLLVLLLALLAHIFLFNRARSMPAAQGIIIAAVVSVVVAAPFLAFELLYPGAAFFRASQVTLFQHPDYDRVGLIGVLAVKLLSQAKMFGLQWEGQYNPLSQPLLDPLWFVAFLIGILVTLRQIRRIEYAWGLIAIGVMLLPDLIGGNELFPQELRVIGVIPPTFFVCAVGLTETSDWIGRRSLRLHPFVLPIFVLVLLASAAYSMNLYLIHWPAVAAASDDANFGRAEVQEGKWIARSAQPVLVPLNEYARQPVRYLAGAQFPGIRSALDATGTFRSGLLAGSALVMLPIDPARVRFEGRVYADDPTAYVLLRDGAAYVLPPLREPLSASLQSRTPEQTIPYPFGSVARVYAVALPDLRFAAPPATTPLRFGPNVVLAGYALDAQRARPGDMLTFTLWWRTAKRLPDDEMIFVHLLDVNQDVAANADVIPGLGAYSTFLWKPDEVIATHHQLQVPARLRPGRYSIEIGMYNIVDGNRLEVLDPQGKAIDSRLVLGKVKIAPRQAPAYNPTHIQRVDFDGQLLLNGYDLAPTDDPTHMRVSLYWQANAEMPIDYTVFVHVLNATGAIVAQVDHQPQSGNYPTSIWDNGESVRDDFDLLLPADTPSGAYTLEIGWYELETGRRLPVLGANQAAAKDSVVLETPLEVGRR